MIEKRKLKNGRTVYRVRWRIGGRGTREQVRSFDRRADAERFETEMRRRKQLGELASVKPSRVTLDEFARAGLLLARGGNLHRPQPGGGRAHG